MAQPAETRHVPVDHARSIQAAWKILSIELRIAPRTGDGSDIHQLPDTVRFEDRDELLDRMRGVTDRENHIHHASS